MADGFLPVRVEVKGDLKDVCSTADKVVDALGRGMGFVAAPFLRVANAKAEKIAKRIEAESAADVEDLLQHRATQRELNRIKNLDAIARNALQHLPDHVSNEPVSTDWSTRFVNDAQDAPTEELRQAYARLLAAEVSKPNSISKRSLRVFADLDPHEAHLFSRLSRISLVELDGSGAFVPLVIKPGSPPSFSSNDLASWGLSYSEMLRLQDAGILLVQNGLLVDVKVAASLRLGSNTIRIVPPQQSSVQVPIVRLTNEGSQLLCVCDKREEREFLETVVSDYASRGLSITII